MSSEEREEWERRRRLIEHINGGLEEPEANPLDEHIAWTNEQRETPLTEEQHRAIAILNQQRQAELAEELRLCKQALANERRITDTLKEIMKQDHKVRLAIAKQRGWPHRLRGWLRSAIGR